MADEGKADWAGVGEAWTSFGRTLKDRTKDGADAVQLSTREADGASEQFGSALRTALAQFDATVTDPEVRQSARHATGQLLDALKASLGSDDPAPPAEDPKPLTGS